MRRFDMRLPAIVRVEGTNEFHTETQNVSARGVFFYLDEPVEAGAKLEVTLTFPPHVTLTDAVREAKVALLAAAVCAAVSYVCRGISSLSTSSL